VSGRSVTGRVALVEDDYTLVINRGAEAGVTPGMVFAVYSGPGRVITDPDTGRELGRLNREKLRVRVFDVAPLFARAHTFLDIGDFHGLLQVPFMTEPSEDVVTVDVGDTVELVGTVGAGGSGHRTAESG
jgi:hypothetical protein